MHFQFRTYNYICSKAEIDLIRPYIERTDEWREAIWKGKNNSPDFASLSPHYIWQGIKSKEATCNVKGRKKWLMSNVDQEEQYHVPSNVHSREWTKNVKDLNTKINCALKRFTAI